MYISCVSYTHNVTAKGFYLVIVATTVETDKPELELKPGLDRSFLTFTDVLTSQ
ncbi:hypothetical protein ACDT12_13615 [Staphylococcus aureus]